MSSSLYGATGMGSALKGTGYKAVSNQNPQQAQLFKQLIGSLTGNQGLSKGLADTSSLAGGDQSAFAAMEAPALRQFGQLQGNIASRFSGLGSGARKSSGFQNTMSGYGADLAERLQGNRMSLQRQAIQDLLGLSQSLLGQDTFSLTPKKKSFLQELLGSFGGNASGALGMLPFMWGK